jgi:hypothetical protein
MTGNWKTENLVLKTAKCQNEQWYEGAIYANQKLDQTNEFISDSRQQFAPNR